VPSVNTTDPALEDVEAPKPEPLTWSQSPERNAWLEAVRLTQLDIVGVVVEVPVPEVSPVVPPPPDVPPPLPLPPPPHPEMSTAEKKMTASIDRYLPGFIVILPSFPDC